MYNVFFICFLVSGDFFFLVIKMVMFRNLKFFFWKNFILKVGIVICGENVSFFGRG